MSDRLSDEQIDSLDAWAQENLMAHRAEKIAAICAQAKSLPKCSCAEPWTLGVVHRAAEPCYWPQSELANVGAEPVAWMKVFPFGDNYVTCSKREAQDWRDNGDDVIPLYAAPTPAAPPNKGVNQCDGCMAGVPVDENGNHRMGKAGGYSDLMHCTKDRYIDAATGERGEGRG